MKVDLTQSLSRELFRRIDETSDQEFYAYPRFVTHIDDAAIAAVTQLYRAYFPAEGNLLDLMSSWISHLPKEAFYRQVVGVGMNEQELQANRQLTRHIVQNLNLNPILPFEENTFDGAGICASVDYLTRPIAVFRELARVMKPDAPLVVTFSNRCFPTKAIAAWHMLDDHGRMDLVAQYFDMAGSWAAVEKVDLSSQNPTGDPLFAVIGRVSK